MGEEDLMNESEPFGITKAEMSVQRLRQRGQLETRSPLVIPGASSQIRLKEKETTHSSDLSLTDLLPLKKSKKQKREVKKVVPKTSQVCLMIHEIRQIAHHSNKNRSSFCIDHNLCVSI